MSVTSVLDESGEGQQTTSRDCSGTYRRPECPTIEAAASSFSIVNSLALPPKDPQPPPTTTN